MSEAIAKSPAHSRAGLKRVLELPSVYAVFKELISPSHRRQAFVDEFIPTQPGARVLDVGCGGGWVLQYLPTSVDYVGYDLTRLCSQCSGALWGARPFFCADITCGGAPEMEGEFDVVIALGLLHHLPMGKPFNFASVSTPISSPGGDS